MDTGEGGVAFSEENNLVFGEGGAGTFSDGKIYTRRRDGELGFVFRRLVDFGADPDVMRESWAHLGTDKIRAILPPMRRRLQELGVNIHFHTRVTGLCIEQGVCRGVTTSDGTVISADAVFMAVGHSARQPPNDGGRGSGGFRPKHRCGRTRRAPPKDCRRGTLR